MSKTFGESGLKYVTTVELFSHPEICEILHQVIDFPAHTGLLFQLVLISMLVNQEMVGGFKTPRYVY